MQWIPAGTQTRSFTPELEQSHYCRVETLTKRLHAALWCSTLQHFAHRTASLSISQNRTLDRLQLYRNHRTVKGPHKDEGGAQRLCTGPATPHPSPCPICLTRWGHQKMEGRTGCPCSATWRRRRAKLFTQHQDKHVNAGSKKVQNRRKDVVCLEQS